MDVYEDVTDQAPCFPFYFRQVRSGPHENFHYVVGDPATKKAALVDPSFHVDRLLSIVERDGYRVTEAWFTHGHWDHIGGLQDALDAGASVVVHEALRDHKGLAAAPPQHMRYVQDGDTWKLGETPVRALHTPGHQPESTCFLAGDEMTALFGGDCLFIDSCGRTDFPGGDTDAMFASMARLRGLDGPEDIVVMPGHDYADRTQETLALQTRNNPALATTDRDAFEALPFLRG